MKYGAGKIKKLVQSCVQDALNKQQRQHDAEIKEIKDAHAQEIELLQIQHNSRKAVLERETAHARKKADDYRLAYYNTQKAADELAGNVQSLRVWFNEFFKDTHYSEQRLLTAFGRIENSAGAIQQVAIKDKNKGGG